MPDAPTDAGETRLPRRRRRWMALAVLALALALAFWARSALDGWVRQSLELLVEDRLAGQLTFGHFRLELLSLRASFSEMELRVPRGGGESWRLAVKSGRVRLKPASLLGLPARRIRLSELELDEPLLDWERSTPIARPGPRGRGPRPFDLEVERLELRNGRLLYMDDAPPWSFHAREVELRAGWSARAGALVGDASLQVEVRRPPFVHPLDLTLRSAFELRRHDVALEGLEFRGAGLHGTLSSNVRLSSPTAILAHGRLQVHLDEFRDLLDPALPAMAGELDGPVSLEVSAGKVTVRGGFQAEKPRFGSFEADSAAMIYRYADRKFELLELEAQAHGGSVSGTLETVLGQSAEFRLTAGGHGIDTHTLLSSFGLPLPLQSVLDFDLALSGQTGERSTWEGQGSYSARTDPSANGDIPVHGQGELRLGAGRVETRSDLELASARLDMDLSIGLSHPREATIEIEGTTDNARHTQLAAGRIVESLGPRLPEIARRRLHGAGAVRASIRLGLETRLGLSLELRDGRWHDRAFDRARLELDAADGEVTIRELELTHGDERLSGSARFQTEPFSVRELQLEAEALDLEWVLSSADLDLDASGRLDASILVEQRPEGRFGSGTLRLVEGRILGEPYEEAVATVEVEPDEVRVGSLLVVGPAAEGAASLRWFPRQGLWLIDLDQARVRLESLEAIRASELPLQGEVRLSGKLQVSSSSIDGALDLTGREWRYRGRRVGSPSGTADFAGKRLHAELREESGWSAAIEFNPGADAPLFAAVDLEEWTLPFLEQDPELGWARVSGRATIKAAPGRPETVRVDGVVDQLDVLWAGERLETARPVTVKFDRSTLQISPLRLIGPGTDLTGELRYDMEADEMRAETSGVLDAGILRAVFPDLIAAGEVEVRLTAEGNLAAPKIRGSLGSENGRARWRGRPQSLAQIAFRLDLDGEQATLKSLRGRLGNGEIRATGSAKYFGFTLVDFGAIVDVAHVRVLEPEGFRGDFAGRITLRGTSTETTLGGDLTLLRGVYEKDFDLLKFRRQGSRQYSPTDPSELPSNVELDLHLSSDGNAWVRNDLAEVESSFDLHVGGSLNRPQVTGRLVLMEGGTLEFRDVEYEVRSGSLDFVELERIDPYLTLRAETQVRDFTIFLRVEGTLEHFDYKLTSEPSLPTQDIIALLTTGNTLEEITGSRSEAAVGGDVAANYFSGALSAVFEKRLERLLGLETVRIDPLLAEGESDPTTRLTIGEEVVDDVFVVFSTDLSNNENQLYQVDWRLSNRFRLSARRDTAGGIGGDVRFTNRFWWNKPTPAPRPPSPAGGPASTVPDDHRVVGSVRIEGVEPPDAASLRRLLDLQTGQLFSRSAMFRDVEAIKRHYVRAGRIETRVDASIGKTDAPIDVTYLVSPSPLVSVEFRGTTRKEERRLRPILETLWIESVFSEELYDDAVYRIREFYHGRGHYAADVRSRTELADGRRRVLFEVESGAPVRVERVTIRGARGIPEARIRAQMLTRPTTMLQRQPLMAQVLADDVAAIRSLFRDEGFLHVRVSEPRILLSSAADAAEIELEIEEGPQSTISEVWFPPDLPFSVDEMQAWAGAELGQVFSPLALLRAESRLRAEVDLRGYPDARVQSRVDLEGAQARVSFEIDPGSQKRVGEVRIRGNRLTREKVVRRELELAEGELISRADILRTQHRLYQLGIFRNVSLSYSPMDPGDPTVQRLEITLEESAPLSTSVGLGYDSEAKARVSFSLTHENLSGYDRVLSVQGKASSLEQRLVLVGREPRLFNHRGLEGLASVGWEESKQPGFTDENWTVAFRAGRRLNARWSSFARYAFQFVELSDVTISQVELDAERLVDGRLGDLGVGLVRDSRDNPFLPRRGTFLELSARLFAKPLGSEFTFAKTRASASGVHRLRWGSAIAGGARIGLAIPFGSGDAVPISAAFFAGGDSTIRAFPRDEVGPASGGEALLILNGEFRFPIWRDLKGVAFYDTGNVYREVRDVDVTDLRHVLGLGLRLETSIGPLRLEYGRKVDREPGESSGELFLSIGSAF